MTDASTAFVDLAGFVALTEAHGPRAAADLVDRFTHLATDLVPDPARHSFLDRAPPVWW